jgi:hypothetical protein
VTRRPRLPGVLVACALLAAGCGGLGLYTLVEPRVRSMGGAYTVQPRLAWSTASLRDWPETWTIDGVALERLRFFTGLAEGQPLLGLQPAGTADPRARFSTAMTRPELAELVAESLFGSRYPPRHVRPARFGGAPGFRFEVSYATSDGVRREALVAGAVIRARLHVIVYDGTALYHFEKYRDEVERILESITLTAVAPPAPPYRASPNSSATLS